MKQITYLILLLSLLVYISTDGSGSGSGSGSNIFGCYDVESPSKKNCDNYKLTDLEKVVGDSCCFYSADNDENECVIVTKSKTDDYVKTAESRGAKNVKIECNSNWLNIGISLVLLVLFF